ncbi:SIS domain-containing protein [Streptomyces sp. NBC_01788]|uniref:SIS domain-containing protein n=1 Tax=Streptomyces sp. NBC_01788 TaxID=2975940 RepID=UPI002DD914A1|nr:SIS domain-containing protein [Streptomyces sp. NBC_01788]WSB30896.1 SIS domain-containing protein [Streptomyces sp. NBC_01788]
MTSSVYGAFAHAYVSEVGAAVRRMIETGGDAAVGLMKKAIAERGPVRGFGNGGSSAIIRSVLLQLRAGHVGLPVNESMMSQAALAYWAQHDSYRAVFCRSLADDIRDVGLVVLASVSGRSANIVETVRLCRAHGVPVLAVVGGDGHQLGPLDGVLWATGTTDQQLSEDVTLTALTLAAAATAEPEHVPLRVRLEQHLHALTAMDTERLGWFLEAATQAVADAVRHRRRIYVLCPDGGPLSLAAEHFAHNVHWDAPLGVEGVRPPVVISGLSLADMSAIYNDHPDPAHGVRYQLRSASPGDVVFLLAYDSHSRTSRQAIDAAVEAEAQVFLLHRDGPAPPTPGQHSQRLPPLDDFGLPCLVQTIAHMVCRTTRATLVADSEPAAKAGPSPRDLMEQDLAPLRELSNTSAVSLEGIVT